MAGGLIPLILQYAIPLLIIPFIIFFYKYQSSSPLTERKKKKNLPPSPPKLPVIGNIHQLGKLIHQSLRSLSEKYGDIMLIHLGPTPTLVISSAEAASQVMKTHDIVFSSKPRWSFFTKILNNGKDVIAAPYGEYWRQMRSICVLELLSNKRVQSFRRIREEQVLEMVNSINEVVLSSTTSSATVEMRELFESLSNDLVSRTALGMKHREIRQGVNFAEVTREASDLIGRFSIGDFIPSLGWIDWLNGAHGRANKIIKTIDDFLEGVIVEHCELRSNIVATTKDFVDVLLDLQKNEQHMALDRDSIKGLLLDMFAAGTETSSTVLEWMMSEILMSPKVMQKLQQEAKEAANGKEAITEDDLKNMVYLKATIQETLRLHPPVPLLSPRESIKDVEINGYDIAAGTLVFVNAWSIGRDPRYWEEPEKFLPERFLDSSISDDSKTHEFRMIPFGYGRRGCPGGMFAMASIELVVANLLLKFDWKMVLGDEEESFDHRKEHPGITTRRFVPLLAVATPSSL